MYKRYFAEFVGTFTLSFVVLGAVVTGNAAIAIPVAAALTLALFVYSIGQISGAHINPSVTIAQWSVRKISNHDAISYIVAQAAGAALAVIVGHLFGLNFPGALGATAWSTKAFFAEALGAFVFNFGIASVVHGKVTEHTSGLVVGGSLLLGIIIASVAGSAAILNPAVAGALSALSVVYVFAPIVGAIAGAHAYRYLVS